MTNRAESEDRLLRPEDIEDLRLLISPEARRRGVFLRWHSELMREVPLDATSMRQIILNLVLNACQATPRDRWVAVSIIGSPEAVVLRVDDEGPGMPPSGEALLTEHSARAAPVGKGTGLGLWMTSRLIRELAGSAARRDATRRRHARNGYDSYPNGDGARPCRLRTGT